MVFEGQEIWTGGGRGSKSPPGVDTSWSPRPVPLLDTGGRYVCVAHQA
jgi:hypothetical protein